MERNESFTPGPWKTGDGDRASVLSTVNWHCVAQANDALPEMLANARLIAAAPTLLEALKNLMVEVQDIRGIDVEGYKTRAFEIARAAIALATSANLKEPQQ
jgi:hypothetical protein